MTGLIVFAVFLNIFVVFVLYCRVVNLEDATRDLDQIRKDCVKARHLFEDAKVEQMK